MHAFPARLPSPKETSGTEKDTLVFSFCGYLIPLCIFVVRCITRASAERHASFDLRVLTYLIILSHGVQAGRRASSSYKEMPPAAGFILVGTWCVILCFQYLGGA